MIKYTVSPDNTSEQNRFVSISDFKTCMKWHGEVEFMWNENLYSITPRSNGRISISMAYREDTEKLCDTSDEVLEYMVGSDRLRDVITQVTVLDRSIQDEYLLLTTSKPLIYLRFPKSYNYTPTK